MGTTPPACRARSGFFPAFVLLVLFGACGPRHPADDLTISTKVKIELVSDAQLGALRLAVSTLNGVVTLSGTVNSPLDVERAEAAARRVSGVRGVKSELKVGGEPKRPAA